MYRVWHLGAMTPLATNSAFQYDEKAKKRQGQESKKRLSQEFGVRLPKVPVFLRDPDPWH